MHRVPERNTFRKHEHQEQNKPAGRSRKTTGAPKDETRQQQETGWRFPKAKAEVCAHPDRKRPGFPACLCLETQKRPSMQSRSGRKSLVRDKRANVRHDANQSVTAAASGRKTANRPIQEAHPRRSPVLLQVSSCSKAGLPVAGWGGGSCEDVLDCNRRCFNKAELKKAGLGCRHAGFRPVELRRAANQRQRSCRPPLPPSPIPSSSDTSIITPCVRWSQRHRASGSDLYGSEWLGRRRRGG